MNKSAKFRKLMWTLAFVLLLSGVMPQVVPDVNGPVVVLAAQGKISAKKLTLIKGQSKTLKIKGAGGKAVWSSSKKQVAKVSQKGKVTAMKAGKATITAKVGGRELQCKVTVEAPVLSSKSLHLRVGESSLLKLRGTRQKVRFSSSNKSVAEVTVRGKVTGIKSGSARITAKAGGKKFTCKVSVGKGKVTVSSVTMDQSELVLLQGETYRLHAAVYPANAADRNLVWKSSDSRVAVVDQNGNITALGSGKAVITASAAQVTATCIVWVCENPDVETKIELPDVDTYIEGANLIICNKGNYNLKIEGSITLMYQDGDYLTLTLGDEYDWFEWSTVEPGQTRKYILDSEEYETFWIDQGDVLIFQIEYDGIEYIMLLDTSGNILELTEIQ
ncbi:MAG: Ig-like domain-containing protein [Lachnospiraceae bacterium]|jgi:uncharacterized protein YjdB|nr:Ig-like domain-containing protein [Lachnospiraceae bacterium]